MNSFTVFYLTLALFIMSALTSIVNAQDLETLFSIATKEASFNQSSQSGSSIDSAQIQLSSHSISQLTVGKAFKINMPSGKSVIGVVKRELADSQAKISAAWSRASRKIISLENNSGAIELLMDNGLVNEIILFDTKLAKIYRASIDTNGEGILQSENVNQYRCADYPKVAKPNNFKHGVLISGSTSITQYAQVAGSSLELSYIQNLQSKANANKVLYINNWGGVLTNTAWNDRYTSGSDITYSPYSHDSDSANFSDEEKYFIWLAWQEAAEDYSAFDVNVTTSQAVYDATPDAYRSQIIATTTDEFYGSAGGVAYVGVFTDSSDYYKTGFTWNSNSSSMGMTHSHESGHQMGLSHDGTSTKSYYSGHGVWGPIMGAPFGKPYVQWSKGNYSDANNQEDDLAILSAAIGLDNDDAADNYVDAESLPFPELGHVGQITPQGINAVDDVDVYSFSLSTDTAISISIDNLLSFGDEEAVSNLSFSVQLQDSLGDVISSMDPPEINNLSAAINTFTFTGVLSAGKYYLVINGLSPNTNWLQGFDEYGNGGRYNIILSMLTDVSVSSTMTNLSISKNGERFEDSFYVPLQARDIFISTSGGSGDIDLYVKFDDEVNTFDADCSSKGGDNEEVCTDTRTPGTYHILLDAYETAADVSLTKSYILSADGDIDNDGLINALEVFIGTEPNNRDTDGDGLMDGDDPEPLIKALAVNFDINENLVPDVFFFGSLSSGKQVVMFYDGFSGEKTGVLYIPNWFSAIQLQAISDINGNGFNDMAVLGTTSDGKKAWLAFDAMTHQILSAVTFPTWFQPNKLSVVPDFNGNNKDEVLVLGQTSDGKKLWMLHDSGLKSEIARYVYPSWYSPTAMSIIKDTDGNSKPEVVSNGTSNDGRVVWMLHDLHAKQELSAVKQAPWFNLVNLQQLSDVSGNSLEDVVWLGNTTDGKNFFKIADANTATVDSTYIYPNWYTPIMITSQQDSNGNGYAEIVSLGTTSDGKKAWQAHDAKTKAVTAARVFPAWYQPQSLKVIPDVNGDDVQDVLVLGATTDNKTVFMVHNGVSGDDIKTIILPNGFIPIL
tara:strand:+ start:177 stop:3377 length:3201 start_codon:yes stop_codon:yes gene_type:complete